MDDIRRRALDLYRAPFWTDGIDGMDCILDAVGRVVAKWGGMNAPLQFRYGRIGRMNPDTSALQDMAWELIVEAGAAEFWIPRQEAADRLTRVWERNTLCT